jgi:FeS assembly protein IscX
MICDWTLDLPEFDNEPELANEDILMSIGQEWFEEANSQ